MPCIESYQKVDLRTITLGVPPQEVSIPNSTLKCRHLNFDCVPFQVLTKDSVTVSVDAVVSLHNFIYLILLVNYLIG